MVRKPEDGPPGARLILTPQLQMARLVVGDVAAHEAVGVIHGNAGLGKTHAVASVNKAMAGGARPLEIPTVCMVTFEPGPTRRKILDALHLALTGVQHGKVTTHDLIAELTRIPRLVIVDEAQRLNSLGIELMRHLHDDDDTRFGLLYVGGDGCWEVLSKEPMFISRVWRRLPMTPLAASDVPQVIRQYHPMYENADDDLITYINERYAHGIWRNWAFFSSTAYLLAERAGRTHIDEEIITNAFSLHAGGPPGAG